MTERPATLSGTPLPDLPEFRSPPEDPLVLLDEWLHRAESTGVREPRALTLATTDTGGRLSSRVVLLKGTTPQAVLFGSSRRSRKGRALAVHPHAAGTLYWRETLQQVNLAGRVQAQPDSVADEAFADRPRDARAVAWASRQSAPLVDERELREEVTALVASDGVLPRPAHWAVYALIPDEIEFWSGSTDRLHRRLLYQNVNDRWIPQRLQP